jgi:hypothetical protein
VREVEHILLDHFRSKFTHSVKFFLEFLSTFWSGSINTKVDLWFLVSICEGVKKTISLAFVIFVLKHMSTIPEPSWLWDFIVEETG